MFCCEATFRSWGKLFELDSPDVIEKLFERPPYKLKAEFVSISRRNETTRCSNFSELRKLLDRAARDAESFFRTAHANKNMLIKETLPHVFCQESTTSLLQKVLRIMLTQPSWSNVPVAMVSTNCSIATFLRSLIWRKELKW